MKNRPLRLPVLRLTLDNQGNGVDDPSYKVEGQKIRQTLYMPALVAIQHCHKFKQKYQTLIDSGKPPKVAITAIMRKMLIIANDIIKNGIIILLDYHRYFTVSRRHSKD